MTDVWVNWPVKIDEERAQFEAWLKTTPSWRTDPAMSLHREGGLGKWYTYWRVNDRWHAWLARAAMHMVPYEEFE